jgi:hypothetical protein
MDTAFPSVALPRTLFLLQRNIRTQKQTSGRRLLIAYPRRDYKVDRRLKRVDYLFEESVIPSA